MPHRLKKGVKKTLLDDISGLVRPGQVGNINTHVNTAHIHGLSTIPDRLRNIDADYGSPHHTHIHNTIHTNHPLPLPFNL